MKADAGSQVVVGHNWMRDVEEDDHNWMMDVAVVDHNWVKDAREGDHNWRTDVVEAGHSSKKDVEVEHSYSLEHVEEALHNCWTVVQQIPHGVARNEVARSFAGGLTDRKC